MPFVIMELTKKSPCKKIKTTLNTCLKFFFLILREKKSFYCFVKKEKIETLRFNSNISDFKVNLKKIKKVKIPPDNVVF